MQSCTHVLFTLVLAGLQHGLKPTEKCVHFENPAIFLGDHLRNCGFQISKANKDVAGDFPANDRQLSVSEIKPDFSHF